MTFFGINCRSLVLVCRLNLFVASSLFPAVSLAFAAKVFQRQRLGELHSGWMERIIIGFCKGLDSASI